MVRQNHRNPQESQPGLSEPQINNMNGWNMNAIDFTASGVMRSHVTALPQESA